ncbi:MAG: GNAT family N-acetyltransferase [Eubacterium sp.]|nr:GNAT family N-acetyltransferase [Eubacterium sp.]
MSANSEYEVRTMGIDDLEKLVGWRLRSLREGYEVAEDDDMSEIKKNLIEYYQKHLPDDTHTACIAYDPVTGDEVGCGAICYQEELPSPDNISGKCGYIMNIYCVPEKRMKGAGRKIVSYLIEDALTRGTEKIYLESVPPAREFYKKMGFDDMKNYMKR